MGDHVYQWCSWAGIPAVYQHHAIVLDAYWEPSDESLDRGDHSNVVLGSTTPSSTPSSTSTTEPEGKWMLTLADFVPDKNDDDENDTVATQQQHGRIRVYDCPAFVHDDSNSNHRRRRRRPHWHPVQYQASFWQRHVGHRSGSSTAAARDAPGLIRARVQFLIDHPHQLPKYHSIRHNGECFAVWCCTGNWTNLQAASWLTMVSAGQVKSAATLAGAVSATQVTVPAAGIWGSWLGYTTHVSLASTQPYLLPAIAAYGLVTAGIPALWLAQTQRAWHELSQHLNEAFWEQALAEPQDFVECLTLWSAQYDVGSNTSSAGDIVELPPGELEDTTIIPTTDATASGEEVVVVTSDEQEGNVTAKTSSREPVQPDHITGDKNSNALTSTVTTSNPQTTGEQSGEAARTTAKQRNKVASVVMV